MHSSSDSNFNLHAVLGALLLDRRPDARGARRDGRFRQIGEMGLGVALDIMGHYATGGRVPPQSAALLRTYVVQGKIGVQSRQGFISIEGG